MRIADQRLYEIPIRSHEPEIAMNDAFYVFDNQSVNDFKEMRENAKLTNKINFDLQTKNTPNRLV